MNRLFMETNQSYTLQGSYDLLSYEITQCYLTPNTGERTCPA